MIYTAKGSEATEELGYRLAKKLHSDGIARGFIALFGEVGVGKTVFTRGFASYFGIHGVKSPTYTVVNEYRNADARIFHFDFYRIEGEDDLESIGFYDYVSSRGFCIGEWCERIEELLPDDAIFVSITRATDDENERKIEISGVEI